MQTVKVRLRKPSRVFTFLNRDIPLERNDTCIVRSDRGLEYGVCVLPSEPCEKEDEERLKMTVVRRTTSHDETTFEQIIDNEERASKVCIEQIQAHNLAMKLVDVEYSFDQRKVVVYFTAEERVDFRELVRDLARELKVRIELRHIQVRDEAKMIGGIGTCGRELCCTTWLKDFAPISMKMAKRQNLSLNPSKISGQCGRLMCCLSYENEHYSKEKKARPPAARPKELAKIRDDMEGDADAAAKIVETDTAPSGAERPSTKPRAGARKGRFRSRKRKTQEGAPQETGAPNQPADGTEKPGATEVAKGPAEAKASRDRPKRRRRRRRKRGGGQNAGSGSSGGSGSSSGPGSSGGSGPST